MTNKKSLVDLINLHGLRNVKSNNEGVSKLMETFADKPEGINFDWKNTYNRHSRNYGKAYGKWDEDLPVKKVDDKTITDENHDPKIDENDDNEQHDDQETIKPNF